FEASWLTPPRAEVLRVEGLGGEEVHAMIRRLVGAERVDEALLAALLARGEGNPLYVEEMVRQLQETGGVVVESGEARLRAAPMAIPGSIHDIIAARIDRLAEPLKHTLQVAAVVGRDFTVPLVARVLEGGTELSAQLHELRAMDLVFLKAELPEPSYSF